MSKKVSKDLERMNKDRRKAEEEYLDSQQLMLEVRRIMRDGISCVEELVLYVETAIGDAKHFEDLSRTTNNSIMYSEAVGIRREFEKLLVLVLKDGSAKGAILDGTEAAHRENNSGEEGYV